MSDSDSKGIWAVIGKISAVIALILGLSSVYSHFFTKEISLDASGNCEAFIVPNTYLRAINADDIFLTADEIEKLLPEKLEDKDLVASKITSASTKRRFKLYDAARSIERINSFCQFRISNTGNKEIQDINFQLPREGLYVTNKLGEETKAAEFNNVIALGKLNPGGEVKIGTWNTNYNSDVGWWEQSQFRVTHTNGVVQVTFLPENTTSLGWLYESYPNISLIFIFLILFVAIIIGRSIGVAEQKEKLKKEQEKLKSTEITDSSNTVAGTSEGSPNAINATATVETADAVDPPSPS